jgi:ABC-type multidrug transport system fused ATPase/permease subunit
MERGRIAELGSHTELLARGGLYKHLYELQFADEEEDVTVGSGQ